MLRVKPILRGVIPNYFIKKKKPASKNKGKLNSYDKYPVKNYNIVRDSSLTFIKKILEQG